MYLPSPRWLGTYQGTSPRYVQYVSTYNATYYIYRMSQTMCSDPPTATTTCPGECFSFAIPAMTAKPTDES